jgi:hypothetical protein
MKSLTMRVLGLMLCLASMAEAQEGPGRVTGTVKERLDASVYTYLRVATGTGELWAAVPTSTLKVGDPVTLDVQTVMNQFESKSLHRTFERVAFATEVQAAETPKAGKPSVFSQLLTPRPSTRAQQPQQQAQPAQAAAPGLEGDVLEVLNVPNYTYLRLRTAEGEQWAAVTTAPAKVGAHVRVENPMVMENFESKTLGRHFDRIIFGRLGN